MNKTSESDNLGASVIMINSPAGDGGENAASCIETGDTTPVAGWAADSVD